MLERLIIEGVDTLDHPGIVYRGPSHDRRAALAADPDVWEIVGRLRDLVLVCVLKVSLPSGGTQASALVTLLDRWIRDNPRPYVGQHWPG